MTSPPSPRFMDTNVPLRYFTGEPREQWEKADALLKRVERGDEKVVTSVIVLFETVYTLQRSYRVPKDRIRELVRDLFGLPAVLMPGKRLCLQALDLYVQHPRLSYADAYNITYMQARNIAEAYTWDRDFDQVGSVTRVEPA